MWKLGVVSRRNRCAGNYFDRAGSARQKAERFQPPRYETRGACSKTPQRRSWHSGAATTKAELMSNLESRLGSESARQARVKLAAMKLRKRWRVWFWLRRGVFFLLSKFSNRQLSQCTPLQRRFGLPRAARAPRKQQRADRVIDRLAIFV